ncbi:MAG: hypothetical protein NTV84_11985 [Methanoregula sp.]|nr:hypothetical protein [Methanoregula sp.]
MMAQVRVVDDEAIITMKRAEHIRSMEHTVIGMASSGEDDGDGVHAGEKERLFTQGFGKNTGLGLFLSREILAITGITITENGTLGKGARFEIHVPAGMWRKKGANQ